jgi:predicted HD phosphohydrolase
LAKVGRICHPETWDGLPFRGHAAPETISDPTIMHDRYKKRLKAPRTDDKLRRQIASEAARRLFARVAPEEGSTHLRDASEAEYYAAKRKAAAVLGRKVRPGDLPSDAEIREQVLALVRSGTAVEPAEDLPEAPLPDRLGDHLDRFEVYRLRLEPLHDVKQNPKYHPEGDALYHSLQVFELAREVRPFDEEFLLAALLHDVGKAVDLQEHVYLGLESLSGSVSERTAWLIEHHMDLLARPDRPVSPKTLAKLRESEYYDDLVLLRELDDSGRVPGTPVSSVSEALAYLQGLEREAYLDDDAG